MYKVKKLRRLIEIFVIVIYLFVFMKKIYFYRFLLEILD